MAGSTIKQASAELCMYQIAAGHGISAHGSCPSVTLQAVVSNDITCCRVAPLAVTLLGWARASFAAAAPSAMALRSFFRLNN